MIFDDNIILENDRVRLEALTLDHLIDLLPISRKHPDLLKYSLSPFGNDELMEINIRQSVQARRNKERYAFAIYDKQNKKYAGSTSFANISIKDKRLEIGWTWLDKDIHGSGLNKHCKYLLLAFAFEELNFERVEFKTDIRNLQSRRAIEKIGGTHEGVLRSHMLMQDGHRRDTAYYSIIKSEWSNIKKDVFSNL